MTTTRTSSHTYTHTETATYLTDLILSSVGDILGALGLDLTPLFRDWQQDAAAIQRWIDEESLSAVVVECRQPGGTVSPIIEFPLAYGTYGTADVAFVTQRASLARWRAKLSAVPRG